jgi:Ca-activated chloride channel family protein
MDVDLVQVPVTVLDEMNRPVMGLQKEDFSLFEDGSAQEIRFFRTEDAPISIGLLLDFSRSMSNKFHNEREAVQQFFENANPNDDYFAISFSNRPQLLADATQSIGEIQAKLTTVTPSGYTALFDAVYLGIARMQKARYKRRALLVITDGCDTTSRYTAKETRRMAREADVEIYAIALNNPIPLVKTLEEKLGQRDLIQITEATGGRTIMIDNAAQLPAAAAAISQEMRNEYVLGYRPSNLTRDGKWRKVKVRVNTHNTPLQAYYRKGYSAPLE